MQLLSYRTKYMQYLTPHQKFGFVVVAPVPTSPQMSLLSRLFRWTSPFSGPVWGMLSFTLVAVRRPG